MLKISGTKRLPVLVLGLAVMLPCGSLWAAPAPPPAPVRGEVVQPLPLRLEGDSVREMADPAPGEAERVLAVDPGAPRNPFAMTEKLYRLKNRPEPSGVEAAFIPQPQSKMPKLRLRGHVQVESGEVLALLEVVGGDVYIVREGDTVGLHDFGIDSVIRVQKISRLHLVVEAGQLNQMIIVR